LRCKQFGMHQCKYFAFAHASIAAIDLVGTVRLTSVPFAGQGYRPCGLALFLVSVTPADGQGFACGSWHRGQLRDRPPLGRIIGPRAGRGCHVNSGVARIHIGPVGPKLRFAPTRSFGPIRPHTVKVAVTKSTNSMLLGFPKPGHRNLLLDRTRPTPRCAPQ